MVLLKFSDGSKHNIPLKELENIPFFKIFPNITDEIEIDLGKYNENFTYKNLMKCIGLSEEIDDSCRNLMDFLGVDFKYYDKETFNKAFAGDLPMLIKYKYYIPIILRCQADTDFICDNLEEMFELPFNILKKCITESNVNSEDVNGDNALILATRKGNKELVEFLVKTGANTTGDDENGDTPLIIASKDHNIELVEFFIKEGNDIDRENDDGYTALMYAYDYEFTEIIKLLVNAGATVNDILFESICKDGLTELVKMIIDKGKSVNSNKRLLSVVSINGHLEVIKLLVNAGIDINSYDALTIASYKGYRNIVEFLVKNGADVNIRDKDSYTPLMYACKKGYINIVEFLIKSGANVNVKTTDNNTPLILAVDHRKNNVVELLLQAGADINAENDGMTALALASITNQYEIIKLLMDSKSIIF